MMIPPLTSFPQITPPSPNDSPDGGSGASFTQELHGALSQMEQLQTNASQQVGALVSGNSADVHASMIAVEKSDLAFGMMLQLRNKAVQAYQDIANMAF